MEILNFYFLLNAIEAYNPQLNRFPTTTAQSFKYFFDLMLSPSRVHFACLPYYIDHHVAYCFLRTFRSPFYFGILKHFFMIHVNVNDSVA